MVHRSRSINRELARRSRFRHTPEENASGFLHAPVSATLVCLFGEGLLLIYIRSKPETTQTRPKYMKGDEETAFSVSHANDPVNIFFVRKCYSPTRPLPVDLLCSYAL